MPLALSATLKASSLALVAIVVATLVGVAGTAAAAVPLPWVPYDGPSVHGRYTLDLEPECAKQAPHCAQPSIVNVVLTTHPARGTRCPSGEYVFSETPVTLGKGGSFATKAYFTSTTPQLSFSVAGTFASVRNVHGSVEGNFGCGADSFSITLPPPVLTSDPCTLLTKFHADRILGGNQPEDVVVDTFGVSKSVCEVDFGRQQLQQLSFTIATSASETGLDALIKHQALSGLGAGAALYVSKGLYIDIYVLFHRGGAWALLHYSITTGGPCKQVVTGCVPEHTVAAAQINLVGLARALLPEIG